MCCKEALTILFFHDLKQQPRRLAVMPPQVLSSREIVIPYNDTVAKTTYGHNSTSQTEELQIWLDPQVETVYSGVSEPIYSTRSLSLQTVYDQSNLCNAEEASNYTSPHQLEYYDEQPYRSQYLQIAHNQSTVKAREEAQLDYYDEERSYSYRTEPCSYSSFSVALKRFASCHTNYLLPIVLNNICWTTNSWNIITKNVHVGLKNLGFIKDIAVTFSVFLSGTIFWHMYLYFYYNQNND